MTDDLLYPVVYWENKQRHEVDWPAATIQALAQNDQRIIESVEGLPLFEWNILHNYRSRDMSTEELAAETSAVIENLKELMGHGEHAGFIHGGTPPTLQCGCGAVLSPPAEADTP